MDFKVTSKASKKNIKVPKGVIIKQKPVTIEAKKEETPKEYFTYMVDGVEKLWEGNYTLYNNSYIYNVRGMMNIPIETEVTYIYKSINDHFTYLDNTGKLRVCNREETIKYDPETNSYTGEMGVINYIDEEVELIPENNIK